DRGRDGADHTARGLQPVRAAGHDAARDHLDRARLPALLLPDGAGRADALLVPRPRHLAARADVAPAPLRFTPRHHTGVRGLFFRRLFFVFKNLTLYRIAPGWSPTPDAMERALDGARFVPCSATEDLSVGWIEPR